MSTSFNPICNSRIQVLAIFVFAVANSYFVLLNHNRVCTNFNETDSVDPEHGSECDVLGNKVLHYRIVFFNSITLNAYFYVLTYII